jgi:uncharacterized protein YidB (DUF937 family)
MGLMDILNGMQNGPRGQRQPAPPATQGSGGMSPMMMALLGLLAYKAVKGGGLGNILGGGQQPTPQPAPLPPGTRTAAGQGGLGDLLGGLLSGGQPGRAPMDANRGGGLGSVLGGLLGGAAAGSVLNKGLGTLIQDMQRSGQGRVAQSWIGTGENEAISPQELERAAGADTIDDLVNQTGMPRDELLTELSHNLPEFINQLTPDGRLPTDREAERW